jgi:hypothetical protein
VTIEKGRAWGRTAPLPADGVVVHSDAEARRLVEAARRGGEALPVLGLAGGDLCRTLGGRGDDARLRSEVATTVTCDLGSILIDGHIHWFVAHAVLRRSWWRGRTIAVMNAQWLGSWDLGPRAHPADGLVDISDADLSIGDRLKARSRLPTGTHLPHPGIRTARVPAEQFDLRSALDVWLDGERISRGWQVSVRVERDALTVVV